MSERQRHHIHSVRAREGCDISDSIGLGLGLGLGARVERRERERGREREREHPREATEPAPCACVPCGSHRYNRYRERQRTGAPPPPQQSPLWPRDSGGRGGGTPGTPTLRPRRRTRFGLEDVSVSVPTIAFILVLGQFGAGTGRLAQAAAAAADPAVANGVPSGAGSLAGLSSASLAPPPPPLLQAPYIPLPSHRHSTSLNTILAGIEDRLRSLFDVRYQAESQSRRLEDLDRRLTALDAKLERRLDKLAEALAAHDHKSGLAKEQVVRKVDHVYERIIYMENNSINKIQLSADNILEETATAATASSSDLRNFHVHVNATHQDISRQLMNVSLALEQGLRAIEDLWHHVNGSGGGGGGAAGANQDDGDDANGAGSGAGAGANTCSGVDIAAEVGSATKGIKQHIDTKADIVSTKMSNLYNDMWHRINGLESLTKSTMSISNATRREVQELRVVRTGGGGGGGGSVQRAAHSRHSPAPPPPPPQPDCGCGNLEIALETLEQVMQRRLDDVQGALGFPLQGIQAAQELFLRSCNRLNEQDERLEEKIYKVLERLLDNVTGKTARHDRELADVHRLLRQHNHNVARALGNATASLDALSRSRKRLEETVIKVSEQLGTVGGALDLRNGTDALLVEKIDSIGSAVQSFSARTVGAGCPSTRPLEDPFGPSDNTVQVAVLLPHNNTLSVQGVQPTSPPTTPGDGAGGGYLSFGLGQVTAIVQERPGSGAGAGAVGSPPGGSGAGPRVHQELKAVQKHGKEIKIIQSPLPDRSKSGDQLQIIHTVSSSSSDGKEADSTATPESPPGLSHLQMFIGDLQRLVDTYNVQHRAAGAGAGADILVNSTITRVLPVQVPVQLQLQLRPTEEPPAPLAPAPATTGTPHTTPSTTPTPPPPPGLGTATSATDEGLSFTPDLSALEETDYFTEDNDEDMDQSYP